MVSFERTGGSRKMNNPDLDRDYRFHVGKEPTEEDLQKFKLKFKEYYQFPSDQNIVSKLYGITPLVYLWNAYKLKTNKSKPDTFDLIKEMMDFREEQGIDPIESSYLLRVDDYPRFDIGLEDLMEFHDITKEFKIPYLIGVTPYLTDDPKTPSNEMPDGLTDEEIDVLKLLKKDGVEFGLHGMTHRTRFRRLHTETIGMSDRELRSSMKKSIEYLKGIGIDVPFYIPPFNTIDIRNLLVLKELFRGISGGPEAIPMLGYRLCPSFYHGVLYVPVYYPFYSESVDIVKAVNRVDSEELYSRVIGLGVHWSWERGTKFKHFRELCELISGRTMTWEELR
jgi:peptidoglycan/xylan/chitin deacetylase (PgdA/CDA1 family)